MNAVFFFCNTCIALGCSFFFVVVLSCMRYFCFVRILCFADLFLCAGCVVLLVVCVFVFVYVCYLFFVCFCFVLLVCRHDFVFCFHACITRSGTKHLSIKALILKPSVANIALSCKLSKTKAHLKP